MNKVIFLDRDGTINVDFGYVSSPEKFIFLPEAVPGLKKFLGMGFMLIIISNQSGIGRGYYTLKDYENVTGKMLAELESSGIKITDCFYCPHSPESNCDCRKPGTKMIRDAIAKWNIDAKSSFFIGDKESDIKAGNLCSIATILIASSKKNFNQSYTVTNLLEAAEVINKHSTLKQN